MIVTQNSSDIISKYITILTSIITGYTNIYLRLELLRRIRRSKRKGNVADVKENATVLCCMETGLSGKEST